LKIAMVTPRYPPNISGGGEISCRLLVRKLRERGHSVKVFSFDRIFPDVKNRFLLNVKVYRFLKKYVKSFDVFHVYNMDLLLAMGWLSKRYRVKSVATLNGTVYSPSLSRYSFFKYLSFRFYRNRLFMRWIRGISFFVTLSVFRKEQWVKDGIDEDRIVVVPNIVDPSFKPVSYKEHSGINLLHVGNYSVSKKQEFKTLVKGFSLLKKQDIVLYLVGKGKKQVTGLIEKYKPVNPVVHLGMKSYSMMGSIYAIADVFVHPAVEPSPVHRVLYEALLNKLCVVTTGNNFYSSIIRDNVDGVLLYPMTPSRLAGSLRLLISDKKLRNRLGVSGCKRVKEIASSDKVIDRYISIYKNLRKKIVFSGSFGSKFMKRDYDLLCKYFDMRFVETSRHLLVLLKRLFVLFRSVLWCDMVFCWFANWNSAFLVFFARLLNKRSVVVAGGYDVVDLPEINYGAYTNFIEKLPSRFATKNADIVLSVSKSNQHELLSKVSPRKNVLVYNGVPVDRFKPCYDKKPMVVTVGEVKKSNLSRKGLEMFVRVARFFPDVPFVMIGGFNDDTVSYLKSIASSNVSFTGFVSDSDLVEYLQRSKVYAQFSYHEGFGVSVAEAMLCGCIPVVSSQYALPEVVDGTGFKVKYGDVESCVSSIRKALSCSNNKGYMARERVLNNFSMSRRENSLLEVLL